MKATIDAPKTLNAVKDIVGFFLEAYNDARGVHVETVVGAAAAMAGMYTLLAATPMLPGTQYVLSEGASTLLLEGGSFGKSFASVILDFAVGSGVPRDALPDPREINKRAIAAFGGAEFPPISIPKANYPREWSPNATVRLRHRLDILLAKKDLNALERAGALVAATASLITMTAKTVDPRITTLLALEIMIGVSHMRPLDHQFGPQPRP